MIAKQMDSSLRTDQQHASQFKQLLDQKIPVQHRDGLKPPKNN
jgi:hypothetical protein